MGGGEPDGRHGLGYGHWPVAQRPVLGTTEATVDNFGTYARVPTLGAQRLRIGEADAAGDAATYYERWVAALEELLAARGIVSRAELDERTYEFEFGERDEVF